MVLIATGGFERRIGGRSSPVEMIDLDRGAETEKVEAIREDLLHATRRDVADILFHCVANSYFRTKETVTRTSTKRWHYRDIKKTPLPVGEYAVDLCSSRAIGRFAYPPMMVFLHEKKIPIKEANGGQQPDEAIAVFIPDTQSKSSDPAFLFCDLFLFCVEDFVRIDRIDDRWVHNKANIAYIGDENFSPQVTSVPSFICPSVNLCCARHKDCYSSRKGYQPCNVQLCLCLQRLITNNDDICGHRIYRSCTIARMFGPTVYTNRPELSSKPVYPERLQKGIVDHFYEECGQLSHTQNVCATYYNDCLKKEDVTYCENYLKDCSNRCVATINTTKACSIALESMLNKLGVPIGASAEEPVEVFSTKQFLSTPHTHEFSHDATLLHNAVLYGIIFVLCGVVLIQCIFLFLVHNRIGAFKREIVESKEPGVIRRKSSTAASAQSSSLTAASKSKENVEKK
ncbi:hypothetical protein RB195_017159 [Necator americanus]|uniref:Amiloride-sensitive sodium channel n=1 Tax=Necator americanus TaxID=51031 RepID=A0ABR1C3W8_NECAM